MCCNSPIRESITKFGFSHTLFRGIEYLLLQTTPTARAYWWAAPKYYYLKRGRTLEKHGIEDPFEPRYVSPERISEFSDRGQIREGVLNDIGTIRNGDWDVRDRDPDDLGQYAPTLEETVLYQSLETHFNDGVAWEETEIYDRVFNAVVNEGRRYHGCEAASDVDQHFREIDDVYESIKKNGYMTQRERRTPKPSLDEPFGYINERVMEVSVDVARDGTLLLVDGRHRLSIAKILGLDELPVTIIVWHEEWIKAIRSGTAPIDPALY